MDMQQRAFLFWAGKERYGLACFKSGATPPESPGPWQHVTDFVKAELWKPYVHSWGASPSFCNYWKERKDFRMWILKNWKMSGKKTTHTHSPKGLRFVTWMPGKGCVSNRNWDQNCFRGRGSCRLRLNAVLEVSAEKYNCLFRILIWVALKKFMVKGAWLAQSVGQAYRVNDAAIGHC